MIKISLSKFIMTGVLGKIAIGDKLSEVRNFLGEPEDFGRFHKGKIRRERYAKKWLEISFFKGKVISIGIYFQKGTMGCSGTIIELNFDFPIQGLSDMKVFLNWLKDENISFHLKHKYEYECCSAYAYIINEATTATFENGQLDSVQISGDF